MHYTNEQIEAAMRDSRRLQFMDTVLIRESQIQTPDGVRDCWAWAIASATPDLRAALDLVMRQHVG